jgi:DNA invertase Pin-like site-specific DNA recombinase
VRVCGYVRVSTQEQGQSGLGLTAQRTAIEQACTARGYDLVEMFEEIASGRSMERLGLQSAFDAVSSGKCDGLVASKLDRLGRSVTDVASTIERFARGGHTLVLLDVGIDTSTIMGAAMAQMASVFAEMERKRISQRTSEALRALPRERRNGRPVFDESVRQRARDLRAGGLTLAAIGEQLSREGVRPVRGGARLHPTTVMRLLGD